MTSTAIHTPRGRLCSHRRHINIQGPTVLMGPDQALTFITVLYHCAHLQLAPPAVLMHTPCSTPITDLHCSAPEIIPNSQNVHADSQGPCSCLCTCSRPDSCCLPWSPLLCVCLRPARNTTQSPAATSCSQTCLLHQL